MALIPIAIKRKPILNHFNHRSTDAFTEGCTTKIKMLKRFSYGLRNVEVYGREMLFGMVLSRACIHTVCYASVEVTT